MIGVGALAVLGPGPAGAQAIAGRLVDQATRGVVEAATVRLVDSANAVVAQATTNQAGEFIFNLHRAGKYRLYFSAGAMALGASEPITLGAADFFQRIYIVEVTRGEPTYFEFEVAKPVAPRPNNKGPRYPPDLRAASVEGDVLVQFVVDTAGRPVRGTFRVLRSDGPAFARAVEDVLWSFRFFPAELKDGSRVRQLVQMPFQFRLTW